MDPGRAKQKEVIDEVESGKKPLQGNMQKGNYGEMKSDDYYESRGYERISNNRVTDLNAPSHQGIDGVYYKKGPPEQYVVAEAKYGSSQLKMTHTGRQMSDDWIMSKDRLRNAVGTETMDKLFMQGYERKLVQIDPYGNITVSNLDVKGFIIK